MSSNAAAIISLRRPGGGRATQAQLWGESHFVTRRSNRDDAGLRPRGARWQAITSAAELFLVVALWIGAVRPTLADEFLYTVPFHPLLCGTAIAAAQQARHFGGQGDCDLVVLAEGFYCRGLRGDPVALDAAIALFERAIERDPSDIYSRLQLAGALHKRAPASPRTQEVLEQARALASQAPLGAARDEIVARVAHNLAVLQAGVERVSRTSAGSDPPRRSRSPMASFLRTNR